MKQRKLTVNLVWANVFGLLLFIFVVLFGSAWYLLWGCPTLDDMGIYHFRNCARSRPPVWYQTIPKRPVVSFLTKTETGGYRARVTQSRMGLKTASYVPLTLIGN